MRITGWNIDGFGLFNDAQVSQLPEGLTVVYGPNEAGKSTTLAFIRGVLFGFPTGNTKERKYPPLHGGRHGGRLFLENREGPWTVERTGSPTSSLAVTLPDGSAGTAEDLARLMAYADKEIFRNIFAFDLADLDIHSLDSEAVKDRVFASTQTGAGVSPSQARKVLDAQIGKLLKPRAPSAEINRLKSELLDIEKKMCEAQKAADGYPRAVAECDRLRAHVDEMGEEQGAAEAEVNRFAKLESLWEDWFPANQAEEERAGIDAPDDIPENIVERLAKADAAIGEAKRAIATIKKQLSGEEKRLARIAVDDRLAEVESESEALFAAVSAYEENLKQLSTLESDVKAEEKQVDNALADMGPGWDRGRVVSFDASIPAASEVAAWSDRMRAAESAQIEAARTLGDATRRAEEARDEQSRLEKEIADCGEVASDPELDELESKTTRLRALISDRGTAETRVESAQQAVANLPMSASPGAPESAKTMRASLYGLAVLLAVASVVMAITEQIPATAVLAVSALGTGILGYRAGRSAASLGPATAAADSRTKEARELLESRENELHRIEHEIGALASSLNVPAAPTALQVEELGNELAHQHAQRANLDRLSTEFDRVAEQARKADEQVQSLEAGFASAKAEVEAANTEWERWRTSRGIPEPMPPDTVTALFQSVKVCRDSIDRLKQVEEQVGGLRNTVGRFEQRADDALAQAGEKTGLRGSALAAALAMLDKRVRADQKFRVDKEGLETGIRGTTRDLEKTEVELSEAEQKRAGVLAEVSAADEAELRKLVQSVSRRRELALEISDRRKRIDASLGLGAPAEEMRAELASGQVDEWKARKAAARELVNNLASQKEAAVRAHQDAVQEVARISESSDVAQLEIAAEGLRQEIATAVALWQRLALARALIDETVTTFEKNNQGPVVDRASALFEKVTAGHYPRLLAHEGALDVEDNQGKRIRVGSLSMAATQQVYLCLRLGLAEEEASKRTSLPLIMDEVLVNFDEERALGVAEAISDITARHQVLMFTCHPHTVDLMQNTCGDVRVVELDRFVGSPR